LWVVAVVLHALGCGAESQDALEKLIEHHAPGAAYQIAQVYAVREDRDAAFHWLERAYLEGDAGLGELKTSWLLSSLHGDRRWASFLKKLRFEE